MLRNKKDLQNPHNIFTKNIRKSLFCTKRGKCKISANLKFYFSNGDIVPLGRPRSRWEDNIKMDLQEVGGGAGDWMELAQDRDWWQALVNTVMNFRVR